MNKNSVAPIIVIGSHRAGTSMVCRVLEDLGVFMGWKKETNNEAWFFLKLNRWLFQISSANWDSPENIKHLLEKTEVYDLTVDYVKQILNSPHSIEFLGPSKYLKYKSVQNIDFNWGWKDPRNTFTLPLWLDIFPNAKIVHVYRHGVDVAQSLYVRNKKEVKQAQDLHAKRKLLYKIIKKKGGFNDSIITNQLNNCFGIWEQYIQQSFNYVNTLENECFSIKYEDFLEDPETHMRKLVKFCGLTVADEKIKDKCSAINPSRAYAFEKNPELLTFSETLENRLKKFGY